MDPREPAGIQRRCDFAGCHATVTSVKDKKIYYYRVLQTVTYTRAREYTHVRINRHTHTHIYIGRRFENGSTEMCKVDNIYYVLRCVYVLYTCAATIIKRAGYCNRLLFYTFSMSVCTGCGIHTGRFEPAAVLIFNFLLRNGMPHDR